MDHQADGIHENDKAIAQAYRLHFDTILRFIQSRINDIYEAENLAQDVWVKVISNGKKLASETLLAYLYTIARNLVNDYFRHTCYVNASHDDYLREINGDFSDSNTESRIAADEISVLEQKRIKCLPPMRRIVYVMSRFEEKSVSEISEALDLSTRTVENHLRLGRRDVRSFLTAIA